MWTVRVAATPHGGTVHISTPLLSEDSCYTCGSGPRADSGPDRRHRHVAEDRAPPRNGGGVHALAMRFRARCEALNSRRGRIVAAGKSQKTVRPRNGGDVRALAMRFRVRCEAPRRASAPAIPNSIACPGQGTDAASEKIEGVVRHRRGGDPAPTPVGAGVY
jgi:hypothetical protein